jgi:vancomycin resistance protein YoaR
MTTVSYPYQKIPLFPQVVAALFSGFMLFLIIVTAWTLGFQLVYAGHIFPGVSVAGIDLSGLTRDEAAVKLQQTLSYPISGKILFRDGEKAWVATPAELGMVFDPSSSAVAAYSVGRSGGLFGSLAGQLNASGYGSSIPPVIIFDQRVAYQYLSQIAAQINQPVVEASLSLDGTTVIAQPGQVGRELKIDATLIYLGAQLQTFSDGEVPLVLQEIQPQLLDVSAQADAARQILSQPMTILIPNAKVGDPGPYVYAPQIVANLLGVQRTPNGIQLALKTVELRNLLTPIKEQIDRPASNAKFIFNDETQKLDLVEDSKVGRAMDMDASLTSINDALLRGEHNVNLAIAETQPEIPGTITGAELGITELIHQEVSYFYGSSDERIQNIITAAARFHSVLVPPGAVFSMGETMGDVSLENGFAEALIIYGGRTIKGVGGGVCQVSTTLFRGVFNAGFPIVERYSHAYRVPYYEMVSSGAIDSRFAGLDATVYFPLVDFKFKNDSPYWILMETYVNLNARSLTWKFYSTKDGRSVTWETTGPTNVVPAPAPLFEENPDLRKDEIKQVDYAANGADVTVTRTVMKDGVLYFQDQITTHYEPWQAVCQYNPEASKKPEKLAKEQNKCLTPST